MPLIQWLDNLAVEYADAPSSGPASASVDADDHEGSLVASDKAAASLAIPRHYGTLTIAPVAGGRLVAHSRETP